MEEEEGYKEIAKGTFWQFASFTAVKVLGLIFTIFIAREFAKETIGQFYAAFGIISLATILSDPGLSNVLSVYVSGYYGKKNYNTVKKLIRLVFHFGILLSAILVMGFFLLSKEVATFFNTPQIAPLIQILSFYILLYSLFTMAQAAILGFKKSKDAAISMVIQTLSRLLLLYPVIMIFGKGAEIFTWLFLLSFGAGTVIHVYYVWKYYKELQNSDENVEEKELRKEITPFGIASFAGVLINNVFGNSDKIFLAYFLGSQGSADIAVYVLALGLATLVQMFSSSIGSIFVPVVSHMHADNEENYEKIVTVTNTALKWTLMLALPIFVFLLVYPSEILSVMYGQGYANGGTTLIILTVAFIAFTLGYHQRNVFYSIKKADVATKITGISLVITLVMYYLLIPIYGIVGAALSYLGFYFVSLVLTQIESKKLFKFNFYNTIYKIIAMGLILFVLNFGIKILLYDKISSVIMKLPLAGATKFLELGVLFAPVATLFLGLIFIGKYFTIFTKSEIEIFSQWLKKAKIPDIIISIINKIPSY
ncbi:MAG: flippase [Candidatus Micrarchaeota archaeon]